MRGADIQFPLSRRHSASYAIALAAGSHVTRRVVIASPCESAEKLHHSRGSLQNNAKTRRGGFSRLCQQMKMMFMLILIIFQHNNKGKEYGRIEQITVYSHVGNYGSSYATGWQEKLGLGGLWLSCCPFRLSTT